MAWRELELCYLGLFHGLFLIIERSVLMQKLLKSALFPGRCYTLITVMVAWVFFRLETLPEALSYLSIMFLKINIAWSDLSFLTGQQLLLCLCVFFMGPLPSTFVSRVAEISKERSSVLRICGFAAGQCAFLVLTYLCFTRVAASSYNPFIYFRF